MEIVRVPEASELAPEDQPFLEATKGWFKIDFVPKMSRVLLSHPEVSCSSSASPRVG